MVHRTTAWKRKNAERLRAQERERRKNDPEYAKAQDAKRQKLASRMTFAPNHHKEYTDDELRIIETMYYDIGPTAIAKLLNRSPGAIAVKHRMMMDAIDDEVRRDGE